ncbi:MAG TPA: hypothetical protein PKW14_12045 [Bacteroidota bacterium]|nr:hypothetical protein [Bacteroidota bacterium]
MLSFLKNKNIRLYVILYFFITIILLSQSLFNYLGYEFSAIIGLFSFFTSSLITYKIVFIENEKKNFFDSIILSIKINLLLLLIPLLLSILNSIFVKNCSFIHGLLFFILIPVVTVIFSVSLSTFVYSFFNKYKRIILLIIFLLIIIFSFLEYYINPQLFIYNPLIGFFPGLMYDEELSITSSLIIYRFYIIIISILLLSFAYIFYQIDSNVKYKIKIYKLKHTLKKPLTIFLLLIIFFFHFFSNELGITSSKRYIISKLGSEYQTEHFNIYYSSSNINTTNLKEISNLSEFYLTKISKELKVNFKSKIDLFIYPTPQEKNNLIGAKYTLIAKPWLKQIHINQNSIDEALKHELVHIIASDFGIPILKVGVSAYIIEGLAMAIEWQWGYRTLHEYSSSIIKFLPQVNIDKIFSTYGFISNNSNIAYVLSGSFIKYLIEHYSVDKVKSLYSTGKYYELFGKNKDNLISEWKKYLLTYHNFEEDSVITFYTFKRPSMFQKVCFRTIANLNEKAYNELQNKNYDKAIELYKESILLSNNFTAKNGLIIALFKKGEYNKVIKISQQFLLDNSQNIYHIPLRIYRADAFMIKAYTEKNPMYYDSAYQECNMVFKYHISENLDFNSRLRMTIINDEKNRENMIKYFAENNDESLKMLYLYEIIYYDNYNLSNLILAKILFNKNQYEKSLDYLKKINDSNLSNFFLYEKYYLYGFCLLKSYQFLEAKEMFKKAILYLSNESLINQTNEYIEFCDFMINKQNSK